MVPNILLKFDQIKVIKQQFWYWKISIYLPHVSFKIICCLLRHRLRLVNILFIYKRFDAIGIQPDLNTIFVLSYTFVSHWIKSNSIWFWNNIICKYWNNFRGNYLCKASPWSENEPSCGLLPVVNGIPSFLNLDSAVCLLPPHMVPMVTRRVCRAGFRNLTSGYISLHFIIMMCY